MTQKIILPKRQQQVLLHLLKGKSAKTIAKEMNASFRTIEYYTEILKIKFDCKTKNKLIEEAYNHGYATIMADKESLSIVDYA